MRVDNRLTRLFAAANHKLLAVFVTAGFPNAGDTLAVCRALEEAGADLIEIGFPFSDSLVDGPTIQRANDRALKNGMTLEKYFEELTQVRRQVSLPLVVMSCLNPLLSYGMERFCSRCKEIGLDGAIIADLPIEEYQSSYRRLFEGNNLCNICLITARTEAERVRRIDGCSSGFLYAVSSDSTTGSRLAVDEEHYRYFARLQEMKLENPVMVGFGISDRESFLKATEHCRGAIIGSAFLRALEGEGDLRGKVTSFVRAVRGDA